MPDFSLESAARLRGLWPVAGCDEAGRGPLAGPVVAAAVILDPENIPEGLNDSKKLTAKAREALFEAIFDSALVSVASSSPGRIDRINILRASLDAMRRAVLGLALPPALVLADGRDQPPGIPCRSQSVIKGDARSLSIAAASIVAKVARDRLLVDLAQQHPGFGWERNAGYPTSEHKMSLQNLGVTPHHRRSFAPVRNILYQEVSPTH